MTLPIGGTTAAAMRAVDLVAALEDLPPDADDAQRLAVATDVFRRWEDAPDDTLAPALPGVLSVVAELAAVLATTDPAAAADALNALLRRHAGPPRLVHEPGWGWHLHVDPPGPDWPTWLAAASALGLAAVLAEHEGVPWGRCAADGCGRPFLDRGRRSPQRFCSPTCATRERVRRHRAAP